MKYEFVEHQCIVTEINPKNPNYKVIIPIKRMAKEDNSFVIDCEENPSKFYQWVTIYIRKKNDVTGVYEIKPVDIICESNDQKNQFIADIIAYHEQFMQTLQYEKKPWLYTDRRRKLAPRSK